MVARKPAMRARLSRLMSSRWRPVPVAIAVGLACKAAQPSGVDDAASGRSAALAGLLAEHDLTAERDDVLWIDDFGRVAGLRRAGRALVRARVRAEPADLYLARVTLSPEGALLALDDLVDVTRSASVEESRPLRLGQRVAYTTELDGVTSAVHVLDLAGAPPPPDFTFLQGIQTRLSNLQQTGQAAGILHDVYTLEPPREKVRLTWRDDGHLLVTAGKDEVELAPDRGEVVGGAALVRISRGARARPAALVPWAVDRVRAGSWFGEEKMQWVKAVAFTGLEVVGRLRSRVGKDTSSAEVAEDLGGVNAGQTAAPTFTDPEIGWPPAPIAPMLSPPIAGEGHWIALDKDPFITQTPGAPPAFVTTFVRSDARRPDTRIYVTMWDPRQVALHMEAGTVEPISATGEAGPGVIPRTPEVLRRVVGGFNGGFQATHGEFGMQANGSMYLPPKPYAATILELRDGSTAFGAWPRSAEVPDEVVSFRQNLTALVQNDRFNPWGRTYWGGTPVGWYDNIHTTRSGVCLTKDNHVGYFYGINIAPDVLANGMIAARCAFGVHLDMNPGLAGFEFYNVEPAATFKPLGRPLQADWEFEGTIRELPEFRFRARRMIKSMQEMNFPQYIQRDTRDFFYLTARPVLPGAELTAAEPREPGEGAWRVKGLPQHGFPYALATTFVRASAPHAAARLRVLRVDPRTVTVAPSGSSTVLVFAGASTQDASAGEVRLYHHRGVFTIAAAPPDPGSGPPLVEGVGGTGNGVAYTGPADARAALGVHDEDGMLEWIEVPPGVPPSAALTSAMAAILARAGCSARMFVTSSVRPLLGGALDIAGEPVALARGGPRLVRVSAPGARAYFEATPIVPADVWLPLQSQRVRYFKRPAPAASQSASAQPPSSAAPPASSTPF